MRGVCRLLPSNYRVLASEIHIPHFLTLSLPARAALSISHDKFLYAARERRDIKCLNTWIGLAISDLVKSVAIQEVFQFHRMLLINVDY